MVMNVMALTPLLERFESEYGTLTSLALFMGRKSSLLLSPSLSVSPLFSSLLLSSLTTLPV